MSKTTLQFLLLGLILVLAQVIVFNHICLFNVAVPMVFIYLIFRQIGRASCRERVCQYV